MEMPDRTTTTTSSSSSSSSYQLQCAEQSSSPLPPSVMRLWRPAAQRNLRNQWLKLASYRPQWLSASSTARSHATSLVTSYLSQKHMPSMELGVLSDLPGIQRKAISKLFKQQELHKGNLLSSYKEMVTVVTNMVSTSRSMRCYVKGTNSSPLLQFSNSSEDSNDAGDGGGIPVFAFWSISSFEQLAAELVQMFISELNLKRLLVVELVAVGSQAPQLNEACWLDELYPGEFNDLRICNLYSEETCGPIPPRLMDGKPEMPPLKFDCHPNCDILQVYLITLLAEVNIDTQRVDEIFAIAGEEIHVNIA